MAPRTSLVVLLISSLLLGGCITSNTPARGADGGGTGMCETPPARDINAGLDFENRANTSQTIDVLVRNEVTSEVVLNKTYTLAPNGTAYADGIVTEAGSYVVTVTSPTRNQSRFTWEVKDVCAEYQLVIESSGKLRFEPLPGL